MSNSTESFLAGILIGGIAGAAAALLFTPLSGAKAREKLFHLNGFNHHADHKIKRQPTKRATGPRKKKAH